MALAKGGLVPDHVLICPIGHFESSLKLSEVRFRLVLIIFDSSFLMSLKLEGNRSFVFLSF